MTIDVTVPSASREDGGFYHCSLLAAGPGDAGRWLVQARDGDRQLDCTATLTITTPKHYKQPRFLEPLKAVLTEEGAVNLECKVGNRSQEFLLLVIQSVQIYVS